MPKHSCGPYRPAVRGGEPDQMFDSAIASLGGMQPFVPKGSRVLVKPNIGWDVPPERPGNTHPMLVGRIVANCLTAGASEVSMFDHTCDNWRQCYKNSGIEKAVEDAGGKMVSADSKGYYRTVSVPMGRRLKQAMVHKPSWMRMCSSMCRCSNTTAPPWSPSA